MTDSIRGILVLGMHRSGTSALMALLEASGVHVENATRKPQPGNPRGTYEYKPMQHAHRDVFRRLGCRWHQPPPAPVLGDQEQQRFRDALEGYSRREPWALKDPRMVLFIDQWMGRPTAGIAWVGTYRHPLAVAQSLKTRDGFELERGLAIWEHYNRLLCELYRRTPFPILSFDDPEQQYLDRFLALAGRLGLSPDRRSLNRAFEPSLRKHSAVAQYELPERIDLLYQRLQACRADQA